MLVLSVFAGCTKTFVDAQVGGLKKGAEAIYAYDDPIILGDALPGIILKNESYISISPDNTFYLISTSELYGLYAMAFVEDMDKEHAIKLYARGKELGLRVLRKNEKFSKALDNPSLKNYAESLSFFRKDDVPALFATASNWLSWISLAAGTNIEALMDVPKVEAMMFRALELDETYKMGAIHSMLGAYYGALSPTLGGQPDKAKHHFERAFELSDSKMLLYYVAYARTYAVQIQDKYLYLEILEKVLAAPSNIPKDMTMANEIAKMKAKKLLKSIDEFFL
jgi:tetratricopeptide (TPR) repeat protein